MSAETQSRRCSYHVVEKKEEDFVGDRVDLILFPCFAAAGAGEVWRGPSCSGRHFRGGSSGRRKRPRE